MAFIKKSIWSLFFVIIAIGTSIFLIASYTKWLEINQRYTIQNENLTKMIANSSNAYLRQIEMVLEILGTELIKNDTYKNTEQSKKIFEELMRINPFIVGFGLVQPNGEFSLFSGDTPLKNLPSLATLEETKESFLRTLTSEKMVLGRTYFYKPLDMFVIPARKTIYDRDGNPLAVMTLGISAYDNDLVDKSALFSKANTIILTRAADYYRQLYVSHNGTISREKLYKTPISDAHLRNIMKQIKEDYNHTVKDIMDKGITISYDTLDLIDGKKQLGSITYIKNYNLWTVSYTEKSVIYDAFLKTFLLYLIAHIVITALLWWLFRHINNIERNKKEILMLQANQDVLTQLPNRFFLINKTQNWFKDQKSKFFILFVDMDSFKIINDSYGHNTGDKVLQQISQRLTSLLLPSDLLIRQGSDEFIIFARIDEKEVHEYCQTVIDTLGKPYQLTQGTYSIGASIGVASFPQDGTNIEEIISAADVALLQAKKSKNSFAIFQQDLKEVFLERTRIENQLKYALAQEEFHLVYQPQVFGSGELYGVEALVRWNNKELGFVQPDRFITIAETAGIMPSLGRFIIERALEETQALQKSHNTHFQLSLNISIKQFMDPQFFEHLTKKTKDLKINPNSITLEITESLFIDDIDYIIQLLRKLRKEGFLISLDDFGTGYSSLSILKKIPLDELKIDKQFVDDVCEDRSSEDMVETIISIGNILDYHLLVEGVETQAQVDLLKKLKCSTFQGYFFSKPLEIYALDNYLRTNL